MTTPKTARWLDLLAFLLGHRFPVTREAIFQHVAGYTEGEERSPSPVLERGTGGEEPRTRKGKSESGRRKFERDKDELRDLGIEIETVPLPAAEGDEPQQGYRLKSQDFYLSYLELINQPRTAGPYPGLRRVQLSEEELAVLDRATRRVAERTELTLSAAARSVRRKLAFDLPLSGEGADTIVAAGLGAEAHDALATLQSAVAAKTPVRCRYFSIGRDAEEDREIEPYGLFFSWGRWYLVGRARDRAAVRVFRVDRLSNVTVLAKGATFDVPADFSIRKWLGRAPWELSEQEPETVRVQFRFPESRWVLHQQVGNVVDPERDDGGAIVEFGVRDRNPFMRWLLTFGTQADVLHPASVKTELQGLRERVAEIYSAGGP